MRLLAVRKGGRRLLSNYSLDEISWQGVLVAFFWQRVFVACFWQRVFVACFWFLPGAARCGVEKLLTNGFWLAARGLVLSHCQIGASRCRLGDKQKYNATHARHIGHFEHTRHIMHTRHTWHSKHTCHTMRTMPSGTLGTQGALCMLGKL